MQVILLDKIGKLGDLGDTVNVKAGYGRNFLLPTGKAMLATKENLAIIEEQKAELTKKWETFTETERANCINAFRKIDRDGSGNISLPELNLHHSFFVGILLLFIDLQYFL